MHATIGQNGSDRALIEAEAVRHSAPWPNGSNFSAKYLPYLPNEAELKHELERERGHALQRLAQRQKAHE